MNFLSILCILIWMYLIIDIIYARHPFEIVLTNKPLFYILNFTWGILTNIAGAIATLVLTKICKKEIEKQGYCWFVHLDVQWGLSLGVFIIGNRWCIEHEHGHAFQNAVLGVFFLTLVAIPSVIRFWLRELLEMFRVKLSDYDSIWFEGQATKSGNKFFKKEV